MVSIDKGMTFELAEDLAVDHVILRWGKPDGEAHFLNKGRFIVDHVSAEEIWIAPADWAPAGNITFHSTKHGMIIKGRRSIRALKNAM
jgi:hypothetical protein